MQLCTLQDFGRGLLKNMVEKDTGRTLYSSKKAVAAMVQHCPTGFVFSEGKAVQGFVLYQQNQIHTMFTFADARVPQLLAKMLSGCDGQLGALEFWIIDGYNQNMRTHFVTARNALEAGP